MAKRYIGLTLVSGPPNVRGFEPNTNATIEAGQLVKLTGTPGKITTILGTGNTKTSTGFLGVAGKKTSSASSGASKIPVYIITPEQVWDLHVLNNKNPSSLKWGENYKLKWVSTTAFTLSPVKGSGTATPSLKGTVLSTSAATAEQGAILVAARDNEAKKGSKVLVRFASKASLETAR